MSIITTAVQSPQRVLVTDSTAGSYTAPVPTTTEPTGAGVVNIAKGASQVSDCIKLTPFGEGTAGQTFNLLVSGWEQTANGLWLPEELLEVTCTLCTATGAGSNADAPSTVNFCDTLALVFGGANVEVVLFGPANNRVGWLLFDLMGFTKFQVEVKVGTATAGNALWRGV